MSSTEPSSPVPSPDGTGTTPGFTAPATQPSNGYPQPGPSQPYAASAPGGYAPPGPAAAQPSSPYASQQATPYPGQPSAGQQYPAPPYQGQGYAGQPYQGQPYQGQPYPAQPYPGPQYPGQQHPVPSSAGLPYPGQPFPGQPPAGQPYAQPAPVLAPAAPTEQVGRGLLFSLGGIVVGVVITILLWKLNFIASITSFAMAYATIWLYTKGAGTPPRRGVGGVIAIIVAGVVVSLASVVAVDALDYLATQYPDASFGEKADFVLSNLLQPDVWQSYAGNVVMYFLFAALGTFGLIRQLGRAKGAR
ncbi:hypothetical protein [Propionicimonas sp.]|uniref:hypothetical protein n=1 Tax=Propionicimonas sp. TaxID=1955623 RepID=UPI0039E2FC86